MSGRWVSIVFLWLVGVLAAAQLGKMAVLMPAMRTEFGLSLAATGLMISLIEAGGGTLGTIAGLAVGRFHSRSVLMSGLFLLAAAGGAAASAQGVGALFAARLMESLGYLLVVIAAPSLIAAVAGSARGAALALWSTFFPAGLALGTMLTGALMDHLRWPLLLVLWATACLAMVPFGARLPVVPGMRQRGLAMPPLAVIVLALGFGAFTIVEGGVLALLPSYLGEAWGVSPATAGTITGMASAATLLGSLFASRVLRRGGGGRRGTALLLLGLLGPAVLLLGGYPPPMLARWMSVTDVSVLIIAANALCGIVAAVAFVRLPELLHLTGAPLSMMTAANGVFAQCGALGSLIGPPLCGWAAGEAGWVVLGPLSAVVSVLSLIGFLAAERLAVPHARQA